jgi:hypothetical protein
MTLGSPLVIGGCVERYQSLSSVAPVPSTGVRRTGAMIPTPVVLRCELHSFFSWPAWYDLSYWSFKKQ